MRGTLRRGFIPLTLAATYGILVTNFGVSLAVIAGAGARRRRRAKQSRVE